MEVRAQRIHSGFRILRGYSLNQLVKKLQIGKGGLQGMVYSFHKLEGLPHKVVDDGYCKTSLSAVKMYTTCRHGQYFCCEEIRKRFYAVRCIVHSVGVKGLKRHAV